MPESNQQLPEGGVSLLQWNTLNDTTAKQIFTHLNRLESAHGQLDVISLEEVQFEPNDQLLVDFTDELDASFCGYSNATNRQYELKTHRSQNFSPFIGSVICSRFVMLESTVVSLGESSEQRHGDAYKPSCLVAKLDIPGWDSPLTVANVHIAWNFTPAGARQRREEREHLIELIRGMEGHFVLTGDFNALPSAPMIKHVQQYLSMINDPSVPTWQWQHRLLGKVPGLRSQTLDYIFASKGLVGQAQAIEDGPSDHFSILAHIHER